MNNESTEFNVDDGTMNDESHELNDEIARMNVESHELNDEFDTLNNQIKKTIIERVNDKIIIITISEVKPLHFPSPQGEGLGVRSDFRGLIQKIMPNSKPRVSIPTNPAQKIDLAARIYAKHVADANASV